MIGAQHGTVVVVLVGGACSLAHLLFSCVILQKVILCAFHFSSIVNHEYKVDRFIGYRFFEGGKRMKKHQLSPIRTVAIPRRRNYTCDEPSALFTVRTSSGQELPPKQLRSERTPNTVSFMNHLQYRLYTRQRQSTVTGFCFKVRFSGILLL